MTESWFHPNLYAWIPGTALGMIGGIEGTLAGLLVPRGKCRTLVMGLHWTLLLLCGLLLAAGVAALATGQPWGIWYGLGLPGLFGLLIFAPLTWLVRHGYTQAELRTSMGEDL